MPDFLLKHQRNLEYVSFAYNQLQLISMHLFSKSNRVKYLDLTSNFIQGSIDSVHIHFYIIDSNTPSLYLEFNTKVLYWQKIRISYPIFRKHIGFLFLDQGGYKLGMS